MGTCDDKRAESLGGVARRSDRRFAWLGATRHQRLGELIDSLLVVRVGLAEQGAVARKPDAHERHQRFDAVLPRELLALRARSSGIVNGHLIDAIAEAHDAPGDLWLDVET